MEDVYAGQTIVLNTKVRITYLHMQTGAGQGEMPELHIGGNIVVGPLKTVPVTMHLHPSPEAIEVIRDGFGVLLADSLVTLDSPETNGD